MRKFAGGERVRDSQAGTSAGWRSDRATSPALREWQASAVVLSLLLALLAGACTRSTPSRAPIETNAASPVPGQQASAYTGPDFKLVAYQGEAELGGQEITFGRVMEHGKPVVLNFWAGQCPPCRAEMPDFQRVADDYRGRVIFLGLDVGPFTGLGSHEDARRLLQELGVRYPAAYAVDTEPVEAYRLASMPSTFFIRPDGEVAKRRPGAMSEGELRAEVENLVKA
jgi:thiol-disulfide isomerase/thioredoxin